ncbi:MAG TPA: hypothetical protein VHJ34_00625 [Actinomycetota bacterium]|nr:hypothetical protein [Actinomycetota bacterium]
MTGDLTPVAFERIVDALNERGVRYVVIGGLAALLQGVPLPRTADVDITPAPDVEKKRRLAHALRDLDAKLRVPGSDEPFDVRLDERTFTDMVTMTFVTRFGPFDVAFVPDGTRGFDDLARNARVVEREGVAIPVAALEDIARSKEAAGREKDAAHLVVLLDYLERDATRPRGATDTEA